MTEERKAGENERGENWNELERASEKEWREFKEKIARLLASYGYDPYGALGFRKTTFDKDRKPKNREDIEIEGLRKSRKVGIIGHFIFITWGYKPYRDAPWNGFWYTTFRVGALLDYELLEKAVRQGIIDFKYNRMFFG